MAEYISKDQIHEITKPFKDSFLSFLTDEVDRLVDTIKPADVQPVKHGRWDVVEVEDVSTKSRLPITTIASMWCNQCNRFHNEIYYYGDPTEYANYCPHCGAKMDG